MLNLNTSQKSQKKSIKIEQSQNEANSPFNCNNQQISAEKSNNGNTMQQQNMTPFSKFISGLSPISKISKEAALEISNFKNVQGSIYANQQKVNYYLSTPSPQSKCKQRNQEGNNFLPVVSQNLAQKLDFNEYQQTKNNITVIKIQSPVINLNYERLPAPELGDELNLQQLEQGILDQQVQQNNNSGRNLKSCVDLANFMYEFKFVEGGLEHAKRIEKTSQNDAQEFDDDEELNENSSEDSEFLNHLQVKENVEYSPERMTKRKEEGKLLISELNKTDHLTQKILKFEQFETPKQTRGRKPLNNKLFEKEQQKNDTKSAIKTVQKSAQLSEQLQISLGQMLNSSKIETTEPLLSTEKKKVGCNCKKSRCLKLYCDCFANGQVCTKDCNCYDCANTEGNEDERYNVMLQLIERNPCAFKPKVDKADLDQKEQHLRGCNCNKSGCVKKYCECYQAGVKCTSLCKCENCKNTQEINSDSIGKEKLNVNQINKIQLSANNIKYQFESQKTSHVIIEKTQEIEKLQKKVKQSQEKSQNHTIKRTRRSYYQ